MAETTFETRGHRLYHNTVHNSILFIFSVALRGRIQHYYFKEKISAKAEAAADVEWLNGNQLVSLLAKGTGGSPGTYTAPESIGLHSFMPKGKSKAILTASTRGDLVFVRVNPLDIFQPMKFHMKKVMGASLDEVLGPVERAYTSPDIVGDPWKLETGIDFYEGLPVP